MLVVLLGIKIKREDPLFYSLTGIYGIGQNQSNAICNILGLSVTASFDSLSSKKRKKLRKLLRNMLLGTPLLQEKFKNIKLLKSIRSYRGFRHLKKLPIRGQRSRSNAKTRRKGIS